MLKLSDNDVMHGVDTTLVIDPKDVPAGCVGWLALYTELVPEGESFLLSRHNANQLYAYLQEILGKRSDRRLR